MSLSSPAELEAWAAQDDLDLARLPGYSQLVYPE